MAKREAAAAATPTYTASFTRPRFPLWFMFLFLVIVGFVAAILFQNIQSAFNGNPFLNAVILAVLAIGIINAFRQVISLYPEISWVTSLRIADPGLAMSRQPTLLAPMANMLRDRRGVLSLSPTAMRSIIDSVGSRLDERRDTSRYLVNLLIFLGLLGTFFGLLETLQSVGKTINSLDVGSADSLNVFQELKIGLQAPLSGMGTAFSASLFGLSGSLILGFLDLQTSQAQNRFYNEFEEWLSGVTELAPEGGVASGDTVYQMQGALMEFRRAIGSLDKHLIALPGSGQGEAVRELADGIEKLVKQMRAEQTVVRQWVDEQAAQQNELMGVLRELSARMHLRN
jgi:hypothetical protein